MGHKFVKAFVGYTGLELAVQEALYGFVMALTFIISAQVGLIKFDSSLRLVILIIGMNFVWGFIDMYIFYKMDVFAQGRYAKIVNNKDKHPENTRKAVYNELGSTIFDVLSEEDKEEAVNLVMKSAVEDCEAMKSDRKDMFLSGLSCFIITLLTTIPIILSLLLIPNMHLSLWVASSLAIISLFFTGYMLDSGDSFKNRAYTGLSIAFIALGLTLLATYLGG